MLCQVLGYQTIDELIENRGQLEHEFILLGQQSDDSWLIGVNIHQIDSNLIEKIQKLTEKDVSFETGRTVLLKMKGSELAIAGQALAYGSFHNNHRYSSKTGTTTELTECGLKRITTIPDNNTSQIQNKQQQQQPTKIYPRIDPVVISVIWSSDFQYLLLGNMKNSYSRNFFSCLSGFIELCESVEEALCREVKEESGIDIDINTVRILRTQPWPIGRGGGCELMIGCSCVALTNVIQINDDDVNEVRWFTIDEVSEMVENSIKNPEMMLDPNITSPVIPGPYAIAHHLLKFAINEKKSL